MKLTLEHLYIGFILLISALSIHQILPSEYQDAYMLVTYISIHLLAMYYLINLPFTFYSGLLLVFSLTDLGILVGGFGFPVGYSLYQMGQIAFLLVAISLVLSRVRKKESDLLSILSTFGLAVFIVIHLWLVHSKGDTATASIVCLPIILLILAHFFIQKVRLQTTIHEQKILTLMFINCFIQFMVVLA